MVNVFLFQVTGTQPFGPAASQNQRAIINSPEKRRHYG